MDGRTIRTQYLTAEAVAARFDVPVQAVHLWLERGRLEGVQGPDETWRIPVEQLERDPRPRTSRAELEALRQYLAELHRGMTTEEAAYLAEHMRDDSAPAWDRSINAPSRERA